MTLRVCGIKWVQLTSFISRRFWGGANTHLPTPGLCALTLGDLHWVLTLFSLSYRFGIHCAGDANVQQLWQSANGSRVPVSLWAFTTVAEATQLRLGGGAWKGPLLETVWDHAGGSAGSAVGCRWVQVWMLSLLHKQEWLFRVGEDLLFFEQC